MNNQEEEEDGGGIEKNGREETINKNSSTSLLLSAPATNVELTPKHCGTCNNIIEEHAVKALGKIYHQDCFKCYDCGNVCRPKYFPFTIREEGKDESESKQVPLCQNDYFKRNKLICDVCHNLLKGTYYNAFGRLYDEEHFSCSICKETCSLQECFNFEGSLYCKYHYLKLYSKKCKGCEYPITDQHFEFERSGKIYRWHPECYGIHRYWHIDLCPSNLALPDFVLSTAEESKLETTNVKEEAKRNLENNISISSDFTYKTWSILYKFEEEAAGCISDMLQFLTHEDKTKGVEAAALLVLKVNCLFKAIDSIQVVSGGLNLDRDLAKDLEFTNINEQNEKKTSDNSSDGQQQSINETTNTKYKKYPKSFSSRVMMYLQLLRKYDINEFENENLKKKNDSLNEEGSDGESNEEDETSLSKAMSIINALSHYLKLLIKFGIYNALEYNKSAHSTNALSKFLREVNKSSQFSETPFNFIKDVAIDSTDSCEGCHKYIQQECIVYKNKRWHINCLRCDKCQKLIERYDILDANFNRRTQKVLCPLCSTSDPNAEPGFTPTTRLSHLTYLLKIALVKTRALVMIKMQNQRISNEMRTNSMMKEQLYIKTLNDIKTLRSKRNSLKIKSSAEKNSLDTSKKRVVSHSKETISQFSNSKTLTLDDISRIVAMEQSRGAKDEHGFKHFNKFENKDDEESSSSDIFYTDLSLDHLYRIQLISLSILLSQAEELENIDSILALLKKSAQPVIISPNVGTKFWKNPQQVFGVPLEQLTEYYGIDSDLSLGSTRIKIPLLLDELISSLKQLDLSMEGLFRINGNIKKLRLLTEEMNANPTNPPDFSGENAIQLAALLKKFFRELPEPLLTTTYCKLWLNCLGNDENMKLVYCLLPKYHRNCCEVLFSFLKYVSTFASGSKMDVYNLATVFSPNILYSSKDTIHEYSGLSIKVVEHLINLNEDMVLVPDYLMLLLKDTIDAKLPTDFAVINDYVKLKNTK
ncbi:hypothetical protein HANVADRAFT_41035 [Hanseniaspora valbyensis NRRL Y-1626]|uniref:RhoGAP-domain-containing protein n=1 Tax=Hanseniaspora valbyensis NRRL Y-1626 TaxID=766949 RepID=A0A1B7TBD5_9ASCO|nr:hypothetical protein HANVADRAFT_41035 [Hanseniaspora valbyensis NRRL Y-1626]